MIRFATTKDAWAAIKLAKLDVNNFSLGQYYTGGDYGWRIEQNGVPVTGPIAAKIELAVLDLARKAAKQKARIVG